MNRPFTRDVGSVIVKTPMRTLLIVLLSAGIVVLPAIGRATITVPYTVNAQEQLHFDDGAADDDTYRIGSSSPLLNLFEDDLAVEHMSLDTMEFTSWQYPRVDADPPPPAHLEQPERPPAVVAA